MCSDLGCRQTPGDLHPQRSKAWGDTVPSEALLPRPAANKAAGILSLCWSPGRTQVPCPEVWQMNRLCAQFLGAGRPLAVCTPRDLKLGVIQWHSSALAGNEYGHGDSLPLLVSRQDTGPMPKGLGDEPPMCSVPECRQTPGGLHHPEV